MKYLSVKQNVVEFNDALKEGLEQGTVLRSKEEFKIMLELCSNLIYYFRFFVTAEELKRYEREKE